MITPTRVMVTGATGFLGYRVISNLLALGAKVTALVHPERLDLIQPLTDYVEIVSADVWNKASLKGRARNHQVIIHLVGSTRAKPFEGLTHYQLNLVPARNVINMAISDGVLFVVLLSTVVRPLEVSGEYVRNKRDAETYLQNSGVGWAIVRAPALFAPQGHPLLSFASFIGRFFPLNMSLGRYLPLSADIAARGIAAIALNSTQYQERILYAHHLRRIAARHRTNQTLLYSPIAPSFADVSTDPLDETPFGWLPPYS
ncbi:MAG: hypothetical protein CUN55_10045 [Phototrophicales bacterium]|nr:MAG: hypothetical protein CUN55_10045 [Phototrophicales bacterium]